MGFEPSAVICKKLEVEYLTTRQQRPRNLYTLFILQPTVYEKKKTRLIAGAGSEKSSYLRIIWEGMNSSK
jgi:hypothetical protein